jgi:hypothetical protein
MIRAAGKSIAWDPRLDWTLVLKKNRPDGACPRHSSLASDGFRPGHATGGNLTRSNWKRMSFIMAGLTNQKEAQRFRSAAEFPTTTAA